MFSYAVVLESVYTEPMGITEQVLAGVLFVFTLRMMLKVSYGVWNWATKDGGFMGAVGRAPVDAAISARTAATKATMVPLQVGAAGVGFVAGGGAANPAGAIAGAWIGNRVGASARRTAVTSAKKNPLDKNAKSGFETLGEEIRTGGNRGSKLDHAVDKHLAESAEAGSFALGSPATFKYRTGRVIDDQMGVRSIRASETRAGKRPESFREYGAYLLNWRAKPPKPPDDDPPHPPPPPGGGGGGGGPPSRPKPTKRPQPPDDDPPKPPNDPPLYNPNWRDYEKFMN